MRLLALVVFFFFLFRMNRYKDKLRPLRNTIVCQLRLMLGSLDARASEPDTPPTQFVLKSAYQSASYLTNLSQCSITSFDHITLH